ncbi:MAG: nicotinamide riboside transporter PnuC [Candidatus Electrothrix sp. GW3-4]|uniref:nicotinamide riboside transporter PnuC n=1 Tax=Candidatus Electrothrix sp. GW3-4 TaxID=3126740 RepID=UPI0030CB3B79
MNAETSLYNKVDLAWLVFLTATGSILSVFLSEGFFDLSIFLSGILCVGLIAIGRREGYLIGLYNSLSYAILAYGNDLYGEVYLNLFFFIPTGILGYVMWRYHMTSGKTVIMRQLPWPWRACIAALCFLLTGGLGLVLEQNPHQNTPFIDATTNVLSVVATLLMMWRYKEQWFLYILLNIITIIMWTLRTRAGGESGDMMVLMWSLFLLNALFGSWRWHMGAKKATELKEEQDTGEATCDEV